MTVDGLSVEKFQRAVHVGGGESLSLAVAHQLAADLDAKDPDNFPITNNCKNSFQFD